MGGWRVALGPLAERAALAALGGRTACGACGCCGAAGGRPNAGFTTRLLLLGLLLLGLGGRRLLDLAALVAHLDLAGASALGAEYDRPCVGAPDSPRPFASTVAVPAPPVTSTSRLNRKPTDSSRICAHHVLEQREALALVLDQRVALRHRAQADAVLEVVHLVEVVAPAAVDHREHDAALELAHRRRRRAAPRGCS